MSRVALLLLVALLVAVPAVASLGSNVETHAVRLDSERMVTHAVRLGGERMVSQQHGQTAGVATCPVTAIATKPTRVRGIHGTLAHWFFDRPRGRQRAQLLAAMFIHQRPLTKGSFGSHEEVTEAMGMVRDGYQQRRELGSWNMRLAPHRNGGTISETIDINNNRVRHTVPAGWSVTLCVWVNNSHERRYSWESQVHLTTDQPMQRVRLRPVCDGC